MLLTKEIDETMWADVEAVLGPDGGGSGCWCMGWRRKDHLPQDEARAALQAAVEAGQVHARIAYADGVPVGWCTFGPRHSFYHARQHLRQADHLPDDTSWAIPCFFIKPGYRGKGVSQRLLEDVLQSLKAHGADTAEGYPFDAAMQDEASRADDETAADWAFTGSMKTFERGGFQASQQCMNGCLHVMIKELPEELPEAKGR